MNEEKKSYIPGIYNYCDRWCEKCRFTSNCLLFTNESKITTYEILNNGKLPDFNDIYGYSPDDLSNGNDDAEEDYENFLNDELPELDEEKIISEAKEHPLTRSADEYFRKAHSLIKRMDEEFGLFSFSKQKMNNMRINQLHDDFEVFNWFHAFIGAKIERAVLGKKELSEEDDEEMKEVHQYDMNGSAKVAVISLKKSIEALTEIFNQLPEFKEETSGLLIIAGSLLNETEKEFPGYNNFIRPGFDEQ